MRPGGSICVLSALTALCWLPAQSLAQAVPLGPQFDVAVDPNVLYGPDVAVSDDGSFVVVWEQDYDVQGRRFDASAVPQGTFTVNTYTTEEQRYPRVAALPSGFVVVWQSYDQLGQDDEIFGQRFDSAGAPAGSEFLVNTRIDEAQRNPAVAADASGNFVVVWDSYQVFDQDRDDIIAQRFDAAGLPAGSEFLVNLHTNEQQDEPDVAAFPGGGFVAVWGGDDFPDHTGTLGQLFTADGSPDGAELGVDPQGGRDVAIAAQGDGFVTAYRKSGGNVYVRPYDASGMPLAAAFAVAPGVDGYPDVAADGAGHFLVVWDNGAGYDIHGRLFEGDGTPIGDAFVVNSYTTGGQGAPTVAANNDGQFVVTWYGDGPTGFGVFGRRFRAPVNAQVGVGATKLIVVDKVVSTGTAKFAYVAKNNAGITKGVGTDPSTVGASLSFSYDTANGSFTVPAGANDGTAGWVANSDTVAKFVNTTAPAGATGAKVAVIKPGKILKLVGKSLGDDPIDLLAAGPPVGPISTTFTVTNGGDTIRHCSTFDPNAPTVIVDFKEIANGTGRKLVARNGQPAACP